MAAKVIYLNEYRRARLANEYAAAIMECDIRDILRNCGFNPDLAPDCTDVTTRKNVTPDSGDARNDPADMK